MLSRFATLLAVTAIVVAAACVLFTASRPADYLKQDLVIDDAIYYVKPAQNLIAGHGYSLDGRHRTNGVQPLWALIVTGLALVIDDSVVLLRAIVLVAGGLWIAGGWLLYRLLQPLHAAAGVLALLFWLLAGLELRWVLLGMENGLDGFLFVLALHRAHRLAVTPPDARQWHRQAFAFGAVMALLSLARVENGILAALYGCWVAARQRRDGRFWRGIPRAWSYALPLVLLVGAWLAFSRWYSGEWLPISGAVKVWNVRDNPPAESLLASLGTSVQQTLWLSLSSTVLTLYELIVPRLQRLPAWWELAALAGACCLPLLPRLPGFSRRSAWSPMAPVHVLLVVFAVIHLVLLSWLLPIYTAYCTWYFVPEILIVCLAIGGIAGQTGTRWRALLALPLMMLVLVSTVVRVPGWFRALPTGGTAPYVEIGRWLEHWLPPGSTVGAFAAGYVALEAPSHCVVNLDGLINDGHYLRDYVMQHRIRDYFRDEHIDYFADNLPAWQWRRYLQPDAPMLPQGMKPLHCWPSTTGQVVAILATADATAPPHPLGALFFRTLVFGENRVIAEAERSALAPDQEIVASYLQGPEAALRHVVVPRDAAARAVDARGLARLTAPPVDFGVVQLAGIEAIAPSRTAPARALVRVFLRVAADIENTGELELELQVGDARSNVTIQPGTWRASELRSQAFLVELPATLIGDPAVHLAVRRKGGPWLEAQAGPGRAAETKPVIGVLRIAAR